MGSSWTITRLALPAGAGGGTLSGVSCASATDCTAVGQYFISSNPGTLALGEHWKQLVHRRRRNYLRHGGAEHWDGTSWTLQTLPVAHKNASAGLAGVSCLSATNCTAVGGYSFHGGRGAHPLADHE